MKAKLTDEQMRIAIAEACGWRFYTCADDVFCKMASPKERWLETERAKERYGLVVHSKRPDLPVEDINSLPDYLNSLDAMHEAEKAIPRHLWTEYTMELRKVIQRECDTEEHYVLGCERSQLIADFWFYHATARQRAEAFIAVTQPHPATQGETKPQP